HPLALYVTLLLPVLRPPPRSTLFPYTTLFRSTVVERQAEVAHEADLLLRGMGEEHLAGHGAARELDAFEPTVPDGESHDRGGLRSEEHTSELQSRENLVCRLLLEKKKKNRTSE